MSTELPQTSEDFSREWLKHHERIRVTCLKFMHDPDIAEDMTSIVFLRAWEYRANYQGRSLFSTWLHRIAVNVCLMHLRRYKLPMASLDEMEAQFADGDSGAYMKAISRRDGDLESVPDRHTARAGLAGLPPFLRVPLVLTSIEGYSLDEAASLLGVSLAALKSRRYRGRNEMRKILGVPGHASGVDSPEDHV